MYIYFQTYSFHIYIFFNEHQGSSAAGTLVQGDGEAYLLEHNVRAGRDVYWSNNHDGTGKNLLGLQLMLIREELADKATSPGSDVALCFGVFWGYILNIKKEGNLSMICRRCTNHAERVPYRFRFTPQICPTEIQNHV